MKLISLDNVSFTYEKSAEPALNGVSLSISEGEFIGMVGPTGSGKSTLSLCLNGLIPNSVNGKFSGAVKVCGKDTSKNAVSKVAKEVGMVFQDPDSQIFALDMFDEIAFGPRNFGLSEEEVRKRVEYAADAVGIAHLMDRGTGQLSEGQKQKLCIASVIASRPRIIVLDEPTSSLDYRGTSEIYSILRELNKEGTTIIAIEHKLEWLRRACSRIVAMDDGSVVLDGKPGKTLSDPLLQALGVAPPVPGVIKLGLPLDALKGVYSDD